MRVWAIFTCLLLPQVSTAGDVATPEWKKSPPVELAVGDLVFRRGYGPWTSYFISASAREKRFSHVGVVSDIRDEVILVHADADERTGNGCVHHEGWQGFFADALECAVFRFDGSSSVATDIAFNANRRLGVGFDSMFNMGDTNRLYCTEMVRLAVNEAVGTNLVGFTKVCGCNVVAIDDLYRNGFRRIYDSCHPELCTNEVGNIKGLLQKEEIAE